MKTRDPIPMGRLPSGVCPPSRPSFTSISKNMAMLRLMVMMWATSWLHGFKALGSSLIDLVVMLQHYAFSNSYGFCSPLCLKPAQFPLSLSHPNPTAWSWIDCFTPGKNGSPLIFGTCHISMYLWSSFFNMCIYVQSATVLFWATKDVSLSAQSCLVCVWCTCS